MRTSGRPLTRRDRDAIAAMGAALRTASEIADSMIARMTIAGQAITPTLRQIAKSAVLVQVFDAQPRHRHVPDYQDVIGWLDRHVGEGGTRMYAGRAMRVDPRDHAGLGLPCDICGERCTIDDRGGPFQWLALQVLRSEQGRSAVEAALARDRVGTWPAAAPDRAGSAGAYRHGDSWHWTGGVGG